MTTLGPADVDLLIRVDNVHPMTGVSLSGRNVVAVKAGRIVAIQSADRSDWRAREVIDLPPGATLTPGLVDAHSHPLMGLGITDGVDLTSATRPEEVARLLKADAPDERGWLLGWGLDPSALGFDATVPTAQLDGIAGERPVFLRFGDLHSAFANAEALRRAGIDGPRQLPGGAYIEVAAGRPTGILQEFAAIALVEDAIPTEPAMQRNRRLDSLLRSMSASGLTAVHAMDAEGTPEAILTMAESRGDLPLRLRLSPWLGPEDDMNDILRRLGAHGRRWCIEGIKMFLDGTIDNGTAWLSLPDVAGDSRLPLWSDPHDYTRTLRFLDDAGIPTATHAIGDAAVHHVAAALAGRQLRAHHRIEHLELVRDDTLRLLATPHLAVSMQPTHCSHFVRANGSDTWSVRLGSRAAHGWRIRDMVEADAVVALGSDWPVASFAPLDIMASARLRRPGDRPTLMPVQPQQALTADEALAGFTTGAMRSIGVDGGALRVGAPADLAVFDRDLLAVPADELVHVETLLTVLGGEPVHRSE